MGVDFETVTHKDSTPHTLEVIKTDRQYLRRLVEWHASDRRVEANTASFLQRHNLVLPPPSETKNDGCDASASISDSGNASSSTQALQPRLNPPPEMQQESSIPGDK